MADDVERLRAAFIAIDGEFSELDTKIKSDLLVDLEAKIASLENKINTSIDNINPFAELGLYLDSDGDICQDFDGNHNTNPGSGSGNDDNPNPDKIASDEEIDEMLDEIFNP